MKQIFKKAVISSLVLATAVSATAFCKSSDKLEWMNLNTSVSANSDCGITGEKCGDEMSWNFHEDTGLLEISGKGEMYGYNCEWFSCEEDENFVPWNSFKDEIKSVSVESGVTSIGVFAFSECKNLTCVSLPETIKTIGRNAFSECENLSDIKLPDGLEEIGDWAFSGCGKLTDVELPDGLKMIDRAAFESTGIKEISVPENIEVLGRGAFGVCEKLEKVKLPANLTCIARELFACCGALEEIQIPEAVTYIGRSAFDGCEKLRKINIPDGVTEINMEAFAGCESLENIELPDNISFIGIDAFIGTGIYNNSSNWDNDVLYINGYLIAAKETISGDYEIKDGTKLVASYAFNNCAELKNVTVPASVEIICPTPFTECGKLESITILGKETKLMCDSLVSDYDAPVYYTIHCVSGSDAERFAKEYSVPYELIESGEKGDVDLNGTINSNDALVVLNHSAGIEEVVSDDMFFRADVNSDNVINSFDAFRILQYSVGVTENI